MEIDLELYREDVWVGPDATIRLSVIDVQPERPQRTLIFLHGFGGWARQGGSTAPRCPIPAPKSSTLPPLGICHLDRWVNWLGAGYR